MFFYIQDFTSGTTSLLSCLFTDIASLRILSKSVNFIYKLIDLTLFTLLVLERDENGPREFKVNLKS